MITQTVSSSTQTQAALTAVLVDRLVQKLNQQGVAYSHWKSNVDLAQATAGQTDLDLLVGRESLPRALTILSSLGFKPAVVRFGVDPPGIRHYYGLDPVTRELVHVHLFTRVLTGESLVKSHLLPFEEMLLDNVTDANGIKVAAKPAELVLFTLRTFIKYGSWIDLALLARKPNRLNDEVRWLQDGGSLDAALALLRTHCPVIDDSLFVTCVETLGSDASLSSRLRLARQVRRRLGVYAKHTPFGRVLAYARLFAGELQRRWPRKRGSKILQAGGAVIAIVGADATGKSTLVKETRRWLGGPFAVRAIHTGKPPSSWLTAPVNAVLAIERQVFARRGGKSSDPSSDGVNPSPRRFKGLSSLPFALRAVTLAWDRQRLILKARRFAAQGEIVIADRYPSMTTGAMDSPRLEEQPEARGLAAAIYNRLARLERRLYAQIPPPDMVLRLRVSLETARERNRRRNGQEDEQYLEARHRQSQHWHLPGTGRVYDIDTEQSLEQTVRLVKDTVWAGL